MQKQVSCTPQSAHTSPRFSSTPSSQDTPHSIHLSSIPYPPTTSVWGDSPTAMSQQTWLWEAVSCREQLLLCTWYGLVPGLILEMLSWDKAQKTFPHQGSKKTSWWLRALGDLADNLGKWSSEQSGHPTIIYHSSSTGSMHTGHAQGMHTYMHAGRQPLILIKQNQ